MSRAVVTALPASSRNSRGLQSTGLLMAADSGAIRAIEGAVSDETAAAPLHYTARAGLLSELSRQTYDSLYKALRETILNGIDAGATRIHLDFGSTCEVDEL